MGRGRADRRRRWCRVWGVIVGSCGFGSGVGVVLVVDEGVG